VTLNCGSEVTQVIETSTIPKLGTVSSSPFIATIVLSCTVCEI